MSNIIKSNFLVVSDYNWLPDNLEESWIHKYTDRYLIYDKYHRDNWQESDKIIKQRNVGQNHYDMFDFIVTHYDNLPEATIFCRACLFFPKGNKWRPSEQRCASTGNYNEEAFMKTCNNNTFTELHDFGANCHNGYASRFDTDGFGYMEHNDSWYFGAVGGKQSIYFSSLNEFLQDVYKNPIIPNYIRFSPGGNYIIPKENILRHSKKFYEQIRECMTGGIITPEIWMIERATYTLFTSNCEVNEKYR